MDSADDSSESSGLEEGEFAAVTEATDSEGSSKLSVAQNERESSCSPALKQPHSPDSAGDSQMQNEAAEGAYNNGMNESSSEAGYKEFVPQGFREVRSILSPGDEGTILAPRGTRTRKAPSKFVAGPQPNEPKPRVAPKRSSGRFIESSDEDSDELPTRRRPTRRPARSSLLGKKASQYYESSEDDDSDNESDDDDSTSESESSTDRRQRRSQKKRPNRRKKKFSNRQSGRLVQRSSAKKTVNYKESSESSTNDDDVIEYETTAATDSVELGEVIERVLDHRIGRVGATGHKTTIYNCADDGDPNSGFEKDEEPAEVHYLIKWKTWSHYHNTWESESSLLDQKVQNLKRLDQYRARQREIKQWLREASPEDREMYEVQQEMAKQLLSEYTTVDRVIYSRPAREHGKETERVDYLVKWCGLPYSETSWEDGELIKRKFPGATDEFQAREKSKKIPNKVHHNLLHRPTFEKRCTQPAYLSSDEHLKLRDYQLDGVNWLLYSWSKANNVILADEMGLGKTVQTISFLSALFHDYQLYGPFLLVVPLSTVCSWQREFHSWAPEMNVIVYLGDINSRSIIRDYEWCVNRRLKFNVLITTYEIVLKDKAVLGQIPWAFLGVDEAHRLKNDDSLLYKILFNFDTNSRLLITGTPLQNSLRELWSLLHFIMPEKFPDVVEFQQKHSTQDKKGLQQLHKDISSYLLRRLKKDVEKSLPAKVEQILRVEMTSEQKHYYRLILTRNYEALSKGVKGSISGFLNIVMELKKCCNHCFLVRQPDEVLQSGQLAQGTALEQLLKSSGKLLLLDKLLMRLKESGHRVLIFSQMVRMLDVLADYLSYRGFPFQRLDGNVSIEARKQALDHFNAEGSVDFCFLLSTRAGGLGVNLATADTVIIFDSDWNPHNDLQAQSRAHRIGQTKQVSVYRLVTKSSIEEDIIERAKKKMVLDHLVIQRMDTTGHHVLAKSASVGSRSQPFSKDEMTQILKFGAEELFKQDPNAEDEPHVDIDEILRRAETRAEEDQAGNETEELLSQFKVVNFENLEDSYLPGNVESTGKDWSEIIPESERAKVKEEADEKFWSEITLPPRIRQRRLKDEEDSDGEGSMDDGKTGKSRGRGGYKKGTILAPFITGELRSFIRAFRKFPNPLDRLDAIACEAELQEKSERDLRRLAEHVQQQVDTLWTDYLKRSEQLERERTDLLEREFSQSSIASGAAAASSSPVSEMTTEQDDGSKASKEKDVPKKLPYPTFMLGSVNVNVWSIVRVQQEMQPLVHFIPEKRSDRDRFELPVAVKMPLNWHCNWSPKDDRNLLIGVYEYGLGSWDQIKIDPYLDLGKILPDDKNEKPQSKHLNSRVDTLVRQLRRLMDSQQQQSNASTKQARSAAATTTAKTKRPRKKAQKSAEFVSETAAHSSEAEPKSSGRARKKKSRKSKENSAIGADESFLLENSRPPVAESSATPKLFQLGENLPRDIFRLCKERMRVVKRSLKHLDKGDESLPVKQQREHVRSCLLSVGDHIQKELLPEIRSKNPVGPDGTPSFEEQQWKNYYWTFVAQFVADFDAKQLYKMYKHVSKKRNMKQQQQKTESSLVQPHANEQRKKLPSSEPRKKHSSENRKRPYDGPPPPPPPPPAAFLKGSKYNVDDHCSDDAAGSSRDEPPSKYGRESQLEDGEVEPDEPRRRDENSQSHPKSSVSRSSSGRPPYRDHSRSWRPATLDPTLQGWSA